MSGGVADTCQIGLVLFYESLRGLQVIHWGHNNVFKDPYNKGGELD